MTSGTSFGESTKNRMWRTPAIRRIWPFSLLKSPLKSSSCPEIKFNCVCIALYLSVKVWHVFSSFHVLHGVALVADFGVHRTERRSTLHIQKWGKGGRERERGRWRKRKLFQSWFSKCKSHAHLCPHICVQNFCERWLCGLYIATKWYSSHTFIRMSILYFVCFEAELLLKKYYHLMLNFVQMLELVYTHEVFAKCSMLTWR